MKSCHLQENGWNQVSAKQYKPHTEIQLFYICFVINKQEKRNWGWKEHAKNLKMGWREKE